METDGRQKALRCLISLANQQGYVTFDEIMDLADGHDLSIQDFDWLSSAVMSRGILVYSEAPSTDPSAVDEGYNDFAQSDYEETYRKIIALSPSLEPFVNSVRNIIPPQRQEIKRLKYQIVEGNEHARSRMIEMHLRIALRIALQRAETFDMDIEDAIGYACIGLMIAVDRYDPDTSGAFASYATLWILQNISRDQSTQCPLVYYPVNQKENYISMYPFLKRYGCTDCPEFTNCKKVRQMTMQKLGCSEADAQRVVDQATPFLRMEDAVDLYSEAEGELMAASMMGTAISEEEVFQAVNDGAYREYIVGLLKGLKPREEEILRLRYGFDGPEQTLEQVGARYGLTRERVRQIEAKSLQKLRQCCPHDFP